MTPKQLLPNKKVRLKIKALKADLIRADGRLERYCKHGVGHPVGHVKDIMSKYDWIHGCDGCCCGWPRQTEEMMGIKE